MEIKKDTIAAIATPVGIGGMSVIRISGRDAISRAAELFQPVRGKSPTEMEGYTCSYGYFVYNGERLDDVVLTVFRDPHSYTGEDVVEISCHGGRCLTQQILRAVLCDRVRMAEAGEFTRRAFLNGKMTLLQAEAVADLIAASGEAAVRYARTLREDTAMYQRVSEFADIVMQILSELDVWADYPDEDIPSVDGESLRPRMQALKDDMWKLLKTYDYGYMMREGLATSVVGKPNVGKSTLFNALTGRDRSIVTDIPGTTRDVIEEYVVLEGIPFKLSDTAGMRNTEERIEQLGIVRSEKTLKASDIIIAVFDTSIAPDEEDEKLISMLPPERTIIVCNKCDVRHVWTPEDKGYLDFVEISAKNHEDIGKVIQALVNYVNSNAVPIENGVIATNRQYECLRGAVSAVEQGIRVLDDGFSYDILTVCLEDAANALLLVTGERLTDRIVDEVFSHFCVGK